MNAQVDDQNGELPEIQIIPSVAEQDGTVPHDAAHVGMMPRGAEQDGTELRTTTIREAVKRFEAAGVPRAERTLVKWCSKDATGMGRLDCQLDANERRYYITEESINRAIAEELAKGRTQAQGEDGGGEKSGPIPPDQGRELEFQIRDLEISNRAKDQVIDHYEKDRGLMIQQLTTASREIGVLETKLQALEAPKKLQAEQE